jgi:aspartyl protease family protein
MFAAKALLAMPGLIGLLAFGGLSLDARTPVASRDPIVPSAQTARIPVPETETHAADGVVSLERRFHRAPDGLFYVTGRVNGVKVRFLLDTGATMVVLTPQDAARVGASDGIRRGHLLMETAAGPSAVDRVTLDAVSIAGHRVANVNAAVVRRGLKVSLLGQNLLSRLGPVTLSGNALELH